MLLTINNSDNKLINFNCGNITHNANYSEIDAPVDFLPRKIGYLYYENNSLVYKSYVNIVFEGDSETQRMKSLTDSNFLNSNNLAIAGSFASNVYSRISNVANLNPTRIILMVGTNDSIWISEGKQTQVNYQTTFNNIITSYKNTTDKITVSSILPSSTISNNIIKNMNIYLKNYCETNKIQYLNIWDDYYDIKNDCLKSEYDSGDGVHWNSTGMLLQLEKIKQFVV